MSLSHYIVKLCMPDQWSLEVPDERQNCAKAVQNLYNILAQ